MEKEIKSEYFNKETNEQIDKSCSSDHNSQSIPKYKNTSHLFEIPWNGDKNLIDSLSNSQFKDKVKFIYLPCPPDHGESAGMQDRILYEYNEEVFTNTVKYIQNAGFNACVLIQRDFDINKTSFYFNLGIRYFTIGMDHIAEYFRREYGNSVYLTASITKDLLDEDYLMYSEQKPDLYDIFILRFGYSRDIEAITNLPKNLKYGIMPNNLCLWNCRQYRGHWFIGRNESFYEIRDLDCTNEKFIEGQGFNFDKVMFIPENDLWLFDPYVESYKLIDRSENTDTIMFYFNTYNRVDVSQRQGVDKEETWNRYNIAHNNQKRAGNPIL